MRIPCNTAKAGVVLTCTVLFTIVAPPVVRSSFTCASSDSRSHTVLHEAAENGDAARIKHLLSTGFDVDSVEEICRKYEDDLLCRPTPLHLAVRSALRSGKIEAVKALLDAGFDVDAKYRMTYEIYKKRWEASPRETKSQVQAYEIRMQAYQILSCLSRIGPPLFSAAGSSGNIQIDTSESDPMEAFLKRQYRLIDLLLKSGADPNYPIDPLLPFSYSSSPLYHVLLWQNEAAAQLLLEHGADPKKILDDDLAVGLLRSHGVDPKKILDAVQRQGPS